MKQQLIRIFASYRTTILLLLVYAAGLAGATFLEKATSTEMAKRLVYYSPLFLVWQFGLVVNFLVICWQHHLLQSRRWGLLTVHFSFLIILLGALVSHIFGEEGLLHLREGKSSDRIAVRTSDQTYFHTLPFTVELVKFTLSRYPGSSSPSAYESELLVHVDGVTRQERVFMNNVLDVKGYRFFQASYDPDEQGTVLSVNRDVAGRNITYTGYALLTLGLLLSIVGPRTRFGVLRKRLKEMRAPLVGLHCLAGVGSLSAQDMPDMAQIVQQYAISPDHAERFGRLPMQLRGRMMPINTFSSELLRKLHKSDQFGSLNSDQFLLSLMAMPQMWIRVPLIQVGNHDLVQYFDLQSDPCSYLQLFDEEGNYKLQAKLEEAYTKMANQRNRFEKDLLKLDEQANLLNQLVSYQMPALFPLESDPAHRWYASGDDLSGYAGKDSLFVSRILGWYLSEVQAALKSGDWSKADEVLSMISTYQQAKSRGLDIRPEKMEAEVRYNQLDIFRQCKKGYLIMGGVLLVCAFVTLFRRERGWVWAQWILMVGIAAVFVCHTYGMGMRWYIAGYAPWSNSYETMVYVAWATLLAGGFFARRTPLAFALATLFAGVILFVSGLNWMDPEISPLVPVLKSPWLMFHVAVIVAAYGFFGICCLAGLANLLLLSLRNERNQALLSTRVEELTLVNEMALWVGLALMTLGTFLGAVWANESWGRYWGWDPKETWALITMVIYAVVAHLHLVKRWYSTWLFNLCTVVAFFSVLMTYFGVNYFLSGMHSYGQNDDVHHLFVYLYIAIGLVVLLAFTSRKRINSLYVKH